MSILLPQRPPQENLLQHTFDLYGEDIVDGVVPSSVGDKSRNPSIGRGYNFDGVDDYIEFNSKLGIGDFPIILVVKKKCTSERFVFFSGADNTTYYSIYTGLIDNGSIVIGYGDGQSAGENHRKNFIASNVYPTDGKIRTFIFECIDFNTVKCYIEDVGEVILNYASGSGTSISFNNTSYNIGGVISNNDYGLGKLYYFSVWTRLLTLNEKLKIINNETLPKELDFRLELKAEDNGLLAFNSVDINNNGTKVNTDVLGANTFSYESVDAPEPYMNKVGYSDGDGSNNNGLYIPRDESNPKFDVLGNPLQYKGQVSYPAHLVQSNCLLANGVDHSISFTDLTGISIVSSQGTSTPSINGNSINLTAGTIYNIILSDGTKLACAEGSGTTLYPYEGILQGTLVNGLLYTQQADDFDFNLQNGYSLYQHNTDTVANPDIRVPLGVNPVITNYTKIKDVRPSQRNHNGAETKVDFNPYGAPELKDTITSSLDKVISNNFYQSLNKKGESLFYSNLLSGDRILNYMNYILEPETIIYKNRVEADGGEVIDLVYVDNVYKKVKEFGVLSNLKHWSSAKAGIKRDVNNFISKTYSLLGNDGFQNTGSQQPVYSNNKIDFDGIDNYFQLSNNLTDFSFIQNTGVFTANVSFKLDNYLQSDLQPLLVSSSISTRAKGFILYYENRSNQKGLWCAILRGTSTSTVATVNINNSISDNNEHTFTAQGNGSTLRTFKDNNEIGSSAMDFKSTGDNSNIMTFGKINTFIFNGQSDNFYIFDTNLTQSQITELNAL